MSWVYLLSRRQLLPVISSLCMQHCPKSKTTTLLSKLHRTMNHFKNYFTGTLSSKYVRKLVLQSIYDVVESIVITLLQIYCRVCRWVSKMRWIFDDVMKLVLRSICDVVESMTITLLQIYCRVCRWVSKIRSMFDDVMKLRNLCFTLIWTT